MNVDEIMTSDPECCRSDEYLDETIRRMWERDCGFIPVVDVEGRIVGVITDRDIALAACERGRLLSEITVDSAMTRAVRTCAPDDDLDDAEQTMRDAKVRRLPVVGASGVVVGVISLNDIALSDEIAETTVAKTLAGICEHRQSAGG